MSTVLIAFMNEAHRYNWLVIMNKRASNRDYAYVIMRLLRNGEVDEVRQCYRKSFNPIFVTACDIVTDFNI